MGEFNMDNSIFDLEVRIPFSKDLLYLLIDLKSSRISTVSTFTDNILKLLDDVITKWPYRKGAINIEHFAEKLGFKQDDLFSLLFRDKAVPKSFSIDEQKALYLLEVIINLLHYIPYYLIDVGILDSYDHHTISQLNIELEHYYENIDSLLEGINLKVVEKHQDSLPTQYRLVKRDADVDSVVNVVPELADLLLSYIDIRNIHNLNNKKSILLGIADYLEPQRSKFKGTNYQSLCNAVFFSFNKLHIRHNDKGQIDLPSEELEEAYDKTFYMALHLIRSTIINDFQQDIEGLMPQ